MYFKNLLKYLFVSDSDSLGKLSIRIACQRTVEFKTLNLITFSTTVLINSQ